MKALKPSITAAPQRKARNIFISRTIRPRFVDVDGAEGKHRRRSLRKTGNLETRMPGCSDPTELFNFYFLLCQYCSSLTFSIHSTGLPLSACREGLTTIFQIKTFTAIRLFEQAFHLLRSRDQIVHF